MPAQKGRVGKQTVPNAVLLPRIPVRVEQEPQPTEKEETYFFFLQSWLSAQFRRYQL